MNKELFKKMFRREAITGWIIVLLAIVFISMCIEPWRENREEFIYIMAMVLGGGIVSTVLIMWFMERFLPKDGNDDYYENYIKEEYNEKLDK
jgi:hypothetical protein